MGLDLPQDVRVSFGDTSGPLEEIHRRIKAMGVDGQNWLTSASTFACCVWLVGCKGFKRACFLR